MEDKVSAHISPSAAAPSTLPMIPPAPTPGAAPARTRVMEVTIPPSDSPRLLVLECEASPDVLGTITIRAFRIEG